MRGSDRLRRDGTNMKNVAVKSVYMEMAAGTSERWGMERRGRGRRRREEGN